MTSRIVPGVFVDAAVARLEAYTSRDAEFERASRNWRRPESATPYDLEKRKRLIRWHPIQEGVFDVQLFIRSLRSEDRYFAGEIAKWVAEEFLHHFATDKTLNSFRLSYFRRLDACGF